MITVLRLDHRLGRDTRITTHVCLTARAFGADKVILSGERDKHIIESAESVVENWGGDFKVEYDPAAMKVIKEHKRNGYEIIHLTMYGKHVEDVIPEIRDNGRDKLIIVGGSRVPTEVYELADWNLSVTNQPHSEVAALAMCLHYMMDGEELNKTYTDGKMQIVPNNEHKEVVKKE
ncbi:MAG: tRNA (cytidine(56)-2'-O)-methyltransferase [Methanosphaera sp.]|uniref:tRNA (cytidine(56)-2'-O)-methyltransferase n=1 Tax=Methanosphaera sp. TaxID=2666342 RepID=UPI0025D0C03C|nr:tRNA (cytidine(56)-2'-O)-methyltransferase [Methanosphaera sp.]MCI5867273.1 tRNA (cytidine(56)-2'-O)-methyltransferase [Methanosphaera sp.]MDD6534659.1 tRNA (cytidine(56)-2'-O)-methyltransferase [Methanosphaera sp.]MDY3955673.1 tRNA (cytidine(56)-2'-O)-methyltransferase [Methanosphaera sp.]